jgi:hypothetical protein
MGDLADTALAPTVSAIFAKLGGLPFFRFATRELFYMLRVDLF